jgi:hypothetical protein
MQGVSSRFLEFYVKARATRASDGAIKSMNAIMMRNIFELIL